MLLFLGLLLSLAGLLPHIPSNPSADEAQVESVADIVAIHRNSPNKVKPAENIRPGPAGQLQLSYTDCEFDYRCFCQHRFSYRVKEIASVNAIKIRDDLERAADSPMFGCYETGVDLMGRQEVRCRFVRQVELDRDDPAFEKIMIPKEAGRRSKVWIESAVRVDPNGVPVEEASPRALPILVEGGKKYYQVLQELKPRGPNCLMEVAFEGQVFDLASCKELACLQGAFEAYKSSLSRELSSSPLMASEVHDQPIPPGEMWWRRSYQASRILGPPNFENSSYRLRFWFAGERNGDYSNEPRKGLFRLYMNASETITSSVGVNGTYAEPSHEQVASFKDAANGSYRRALESACREIHGQMKDSICKF